MLRRFIPILAVFLALLLAGCQSKAQTPAASSPTPVPPSKTPVPPTSTPFASTVGSGQSEGEWCTMVGKLLPTPGPTEQSMFRPVGEGEWTRGPKDAPVTIIEYSDFQ